MPKYTVVIKNRFLGKKPVASICSFEKTDTFTEEDAKKSAELLEDKLNSYIDNDIYFYDVEVEDTD